MSDALIDIIGVVPVQLVFAYALTKMLVIRRRMAYWMLEIGFSLILAWLRSSMGFEFRLIMSLLLALVPIVLSKGGLSRRILTVVLAHLVLFFAELPGGALWTAMTGAPFVDYDAIRAHFDAFALVHTAHFILLVPLLSLLCFLLNAFPASKGGDLRSAWLPVGFTFVQLVLVSLVMFLPFGFADSSPLYYVFSIALSVMGLGADLLLFVAMDRYAQKRQDDERAAMLEEQIDGYLAQYAEVVEGINRTARFRHDAGNQAQVVCALVERGSFEEARTHLDLMRQELDELCATDAHERVPDVG